MHVAVIELLRCPVSHDATALVATATRQQERRILEGTLGCPVCGATYPISGGVADFRGAAAADVPGAAAEAPNDDAAIRLGAQLDLTEVGRLVLLCGEYARLAPALSVMFDALCVAVNAPSDLERHVAGHASVLRVSTVVPLAAASMHGVVVDANHAKLLGIDGARALLRTGGRLVASASVPFPSALALLAQDQREWVGVRAAEATQLQRGRVLK